MAIGRKIDTGAYERYQQMKDAEERQRIAKANLDSAQSYKNKNTGNTLGSTLAGIASGVANSAKNVGNALVDMFGSGAASVADLVTGTDSHLNDFNQWKKGSLYGDANMSDKDMYNKTAGTALDAAMTVSDFIPGAGAAKSVGKKVVTEAGKNALGNIGQTLIDKGANATVEDLTNSAIIGAGSGAVGTKLASKIGAKNLLGNSSSKLGQTLSNIANSNVGKSAIIGAGSGATSGGLDYLLNTPKDNFSIGDLLGATATGAKTGAISGGTMAGAQGLIGSGIEKASNKFGVKFEDGTTAKKMWGDLEEPTPRKATNNNTEMLEAITVVDRPTRKYDATELNNTRKAIADNNKTLRSNQNEINRLNAEIAQADNLRKAYEEQPALKQRVEKTPDALLGNRVGSNLDGILGGTNKNRVDALEAPTYSKMVAEDVPNNTNGIAGLFDERLGINALGAEDITSLPKNLQERIKAGAREYNSLATDLEAGSFTKKSNLPKIKTSEFTKVTGLKGEDIPSSMRPYLSEKNGKSLYDNSWGEVFGRNGAGAGSLDMTPGEIVENFQNIVEKPVGNSIYTQDNIGYALAMDDNLARDVDRGFARAMETDIPVTQINNNGEAVKVRKPINVNYDGSRILESDIPDVTAQRQRLAELQSQNETVRNSLTDNQATLDRLNQERQEFLKQNRQQPAQTPEIDVADRANLERQIYENELRQGEALARQYGSIDTPTIRAVGDPQAVLVKLDNDYGLRTPAEVMYAGNKITGKDGIVSKWTRQLADSATDIDTTIAKSQIDDIMSAHGLTEKDQKTLRNQIESTINSMKGNTGNDVLDMVKKLEAHERTYLGKDGRYKRPTTEDIQKADVLRTVIEDYQGRVWEAADDISSVINPENMAKLKNVFPNNEQYKSQIETIMSNVTNGRELRASMKPLVDGSKIAKNAKATSMGAGARLVQGLKGATAGNKGVALAQIAAAAYDESPRTALNNAERAKRNANKAKQQLGLETATEAPKASLLKGRFNNSELANVLSDVSNALNGIKGKVGTASSKTINALNNGALAQTMLGNAWNRQLIRQSGELPAEFAQNARDNAQAAEALKTAESDYTDATSTMQQAQSAYSNGISSQSAQMADQLDRISNAMSYALNTGDIDTYNALADMYSQASSIYKNQMAIYEAQNPTASSEKLSDSQRKALAAQSYLDDLSEMNAGLSTTLANSPLGGLVNLFGGDEYANQAQALASEIGYLQSGANITPNELKAIRKNYIPNATDSEAVKQAKLARAQELINSYLQGTSYAQ